MHRRIIPVFVLITCLACIIIITVCSYRGNRISQEDGETVAGTEDATGSAEIVAGAEPAGAVQVSGEAEITGGAQTTEGAKVTEEPKPTMTAEDKSVPVPTETPNTPNTNSEGHKPEHEKPEHEKPEHEKPEQQDIKVNPIPTQAEASGDLALIREVICQDITAINDILEKSAAGKNNLMAQLFGLTDILGNIEEVSSEAMDNGNELSTSIKDCISGAELLDYQKNIIEYRTKLEDNKSSMKEAKSSQNIDQLKGLLDSLYGLIEDYNEYLLGVL